MSGGRKVTAEDVRAIKQYVEENPDAMQEEVAYHCHRSATTVRNVLKGRYDHLLGPDRDEGGQLEAFIDEDRIKGELARIDTALYYISQSVDEMIRFVDGLDSLMAKVRSSAVTAYSALDSMKKSTREVRRCVER